MQLHALSRQLARPYGVPGDLDSTAQALYRNLRKALQEREGATGWQEQFHHVLTQTCRHEQKARAIRPFVAKVKDMTSEGDRKQVTVHPLVRVLQSEEKAFVDGLDKLGFTPSAVARLRVEPKRPAGGKFNFD